MVTSRPRTTSDERALTRIFDGVGSFAARRVRHGAKSGARTTAGPTSTPTPRNEHAAATPTSAPIARSIAQCIAYTAISDVAAPTGGTPAAERRAAVVRSFLHGQ